MEEDWNAKWEEYIAKHRVFCLAVICPKCETTTAVCECSKKLWINREKHKLGLPVDFPYECYVCKKGTFSSQKSYDVDANDHVTICEDCDEEHSNDSRHSEAFVKRIRNSSLRLQ